MKIIYDNIIYNLQKAGGITTYWNELKNKIQWIEFTKDISRKKRYFPLPINSSEPFIFHSSYYRWCKNKNAINITTVHDFTYEYFRHDIKSILHKWQKKQAVKHSDGVICVSENTAKDLRKFYPWYKGKLKVIYHGYSNEYVNTNSERNNSFLFVGSRVGYKNFSLAVEVVSKLPISKLIVVGGGDLDAAEKTLLESKIPNRYEKKGFVSNEELSELYNTSKGLLYTSDYEGFGIPALESQACGCPVICQNKSSLPEVVKESGIYVSNELKDSEMEKINGLLMDDSYFSEKQNEGFENIKRFSWDRCAKESYEFYKSVYKDVGGGGVNKHAVNFFPLAA